MCFTLVISFCAQDKSCQASVIEIAELTHYLSLNDITTSPRGIFDIVTYNDFSRTVYKIHGLYYWC